MQTHLTCVPCRQYYYRYEGTMPEPPCIEGVHWRVIKDPIKVAPSQIEQLTLLLKNRLDPDTCEYHTDAKVAGRKVFINRPLQTNTQRHKTVYCECEDWVSKSKKDEAHCDLSFKERGVFTCRGPLCLLDNE
jgi:Eukaryotic-type carbonic anhydrase